MHGPWVRSKQNPWERQVEIKVGANQEAVLGTAPRWTVTMVT